MRVVRAVAAVLAWLILVGVVAAGSWYAIDTAGHEVGSGATVDVAVIPAPAGTAWSPSGSQRPSAPSEVPSSSRSVSPSAGSSASPSPSPSPSSSGPTPFHFPAGDVAVRCVDSDLTYFSARPADGWRATLSESSVSVLDVSFNGPGGQPFTVRVICHLDEAAVAQPTG